MKILKQPKKRRLENKSSKCALRAERNLLFARSAFSWFLMVALLEQQFSRFGFLGQASLTIFE
jgi:hypothetical protein